MNSSYARGTLGSVASLLASSLSSIRENVIGTTSSGISYQLRDIYYIVCRCFWDVAKWKVHNGKIEIISFVVKFRY
jgi:hypothetical protein